MERDRLGGWREAVNQLALRGDGARIQWGYQVAVAIGRWTLTVGRPDDRQPTARLFEGDVKACHGIAVTQRPLALVIPRPTGAWRWPIQQLELTDTSVVAMLGPKEG